MTSQTSSLTSESPALPQALVLLFALCCGAIVANLYYAQPIIELIAPDVGLSAERASLIVSLTQIGYALGLLFLVPLADLLESRRLMLITTAAALLCLLAAAFANQPDVFLGLALLIGLSSVSVQMLIPLAANLAPEASRGRVVGNIMSGLLLGILLARPLASLVAGEFGWRAVYLMAAGLMLLITLVIATTIPRHAPSHRASYGQLLASLVHLLRRYPTLRRRALYQGLMFASFSLFWTVAPLELSRHLGLSQQDIALFALAGAIGAVAAPIAGRLADAGHTWCASLVALILAPLAFVPNLLSAGLGWIGLVVTAIVLDFAVQMSMVLGQRSIYALEPQSRARLNALYMTSIFAGGAIGSALASPIYERFGWSGTALLAAGLPLLALLAFIGKER
ncbi:MFS transporter [Pseudomonas sp. MDMC216]|jgi:predicted MFS family arabinose efflux permease|nr:MULTISPECIES: MFS transporter [Pseudomonas]KJU77734.1 MFS transporter [Pseudomonas oleovorans]MBA4682981.1 MFS transporter [Pseudomonas sp.]MDH1559247.1 MFS transporter [Pseudomonas chengduensis]MDI5993046.1 MFS transporter [Pseudomonas sp. MDMC216]MDI6006280.1 MFS transporter [Pseudomonas sp. MDMC17]